MAQNFKVMIRFFRLHFTNKNNMSQKVHLEYFDGFYEVTENILYHIKMSDMLKQPFI